MSFWANRSIFAKTIIVLAVTFVIGVGLCGTDVSFLSNVRERYGEFGPNTMVGEIGAIALVLSALGLIVTAVVWGVVVLFGHTLFKHKGPPDP
jgi:hypothetical protein